MAQFQRAGQEIYTLMSDDARVAERNPTSAMGRILRLPETRRRCKIMPAQEAEKVRSSSRMEDVDSDASHRYQ